jgi:hypothetical protein
LRSHEFARINVNSEKETISQYDLVCWKHWILDTLLQILLVVSGKGIKVLWVQSKCSWKGICVFTMPQLAATCLCLWAKRWTQHKELSEPNRNHLESVDKKSGKPKH